MGVFVAALARPDCEREGFVRDQCAGDEALLREVLSLLEHSDHSDLVDDSEGQRRRAIHESLTLQLPAERIGPYRLLEPIGEGGMGVVYRAEQKEPVRRTVAIKIIKLGLDTQEVIGRFDAERQALALMDHRCIARVHDAGSTDQGRPYFVMEFVRGEPITSYCDRHRLDTEARLRLFQELCDGVHHAHQKGIIHRDLKPSNILVERQGDRAVPKIIDFGVAKSTQQRLTEQTVFTQLGQIIGTPEYMSPEQAAMSPIDVDTRSDIYALGVILYELLVGALPFDTEDLRNAGYAEIQRIISEVEPPRPSTRLSFRDPDSDSSALARGSDTRTLTRRLRGDLDWIVMKCLEKDQARRYASASDLASDVERHLNHVPVIAGPPGAGYRLRKLIRRHRSAALALAAVLISLIVGMSWALVERNRAQHESLLAQRQARDALAAKQSSDRVRKFVEGILTSVRPMNSAGLDTRLLEELLVQAEARATELSNEPYAQASLYHTLGNAFASIGDIKKGREYLERSARMFRELGELEDVLAVEADLASNYVTGQQLKLAQEINERNLSLSSNELGSDHPTTLQYKNNVASMACHTGDVEKAADIAGEVLAAARTEYEMSGNPNHLLRALQLQSMVMHEAGQAGGIGVVYEEALRVRRETGRDEDLTASLLMTRLAEIIKYSGVNLTRSNSLVREALAIKEKVYRDPNHPNLAPQLLSLAAGLYEEAKLKTSHDAASDRVSQLRAEAATALERALAMLNDTDHHRLRHTARFMLGRELSKDGRLEEALEIQLQLAEETRRETGDSFHCVAILQNVANTYRRLGQHEEALRWIQDASRIVDRDVKPGSNFPAAAEVRCSHALILLENGRDEEAFPFAEEAYRVLSKIGHASAAHLARCMAEAARRSGKNVELWEARVVESGS